jgi:hypothetical protein
LKCGKARWTNERENASDYVSYTVPARAQTHILIFFLFSKSRKAMPLEPTPSVDDDAPESFSLDQSKRSVREHDDRLKKYQHAAKQKKKNENRERDQRLKERAANGKRKRKEAAGDDGDVGARMERAMREAEREVDEEEDEERWQGFGMNDDEDGSEEEQPMDGSQSEDVGEDMDKSEESEDEGSSLRSDQAKLPDHLFTSALNSNSSRFSSSKPSPNDLKPPKKKRRKQTTKDLIIG